jgi:hypothetical protein
MRVSDFKTEAQLKAMKVADIKKHVREFNDHYAIRGYSKLKKDQLINSVLTATQRIKNSKGTQTPPAPAKKKPVKKKKLKIVSPAKKEESKVTTKDIDKATKYILDELGRDVLPAILYLQPKYSTQGRGKVFLDSEGRDLEMRIRRLTKDKVDKKLKQPVKKLLESLKGKKGMDKFLLRPTFDTFNGLMRAIPGLENAGLYGLRMEGTDEQGDIHKFFDDAVDAKNPFAVMIKKLTKLISDLIYRSPLPN